MDVIGLGTAACNIVKCFEKYPQYRVFKIDSKTHDGHFFKLDDRSTPEDYEEAVPDMDKMVSQLGDEVCFFVVGSGMISSASLAILGQMKDKKVTVYYVQPKVNNLTGNRRMLERATFGILQQYARSGLLNEIVLISNQEIVNIIGNLPVIGYFDKINEMIASTIHFINIFERSDYVYGVSESREDVCRVSTIGLLDTASSEEKMFYNLDLVREKDYLYALKKEELLSESNIVSNIEQSMQAKKEDHLTKISYRLYSTEYETNFGFCTFRTSKIQGE